MDRSVRALPIVAGIAGGSFKKRSRTDQDWSPLCLALTEGSDILAVSLRLIKVDGADATHAAVDMLKRHEFDMIFTQGVSFSGFNIIDIPALHQELNKPVVVYMSRTPNMKSIHEALIGHFADWKERWALFGNLGPLHSVWLEPHQKTIHYEVVGTSPKIAEKALRYATRLTPVPEPVRVSRLIARGVSLRP